jgi:hypothetical protein
MKYSMLICFSVLCGCEDPAPVIVQQPGSELCDEACYAMNTKLHARDAGPDAAGCPEGDDIVMPDGGVTTCENFCLYQHENGIYWNNECIINNINYCDEIETICNVQ